MVVVSGIETAHLRVETCEKSRPQKDFVCNDIQAMCDGIEIFLITAACIYPRLTSSPPPPALRLYPGLAQPQQV